MPDRASSRLGRKGAIKCLALLLAAGLLARSASAQTIYYLTTAGELATATAANPTAGTPVPITGITPAETLVAIDVRPQNQRLYALGVNATSDTATLYHIAPETGVAAVVGLASSITFAATDFPDPTTVDWDIDFNPSVDRLRVVAGSLNFRVNPNTGAPVGSSPDGAINGGTTTVGGTAYTNSQPNTTITTQYTLDSATNSLFIQNPPNNGTQTLGQTVTLGGSPLDFSTVRGFDIFPGVNASTSNTAVASGNGLFVGTVGGVTSLYSLNLVNAQATALGAPGVQVRSFAFRSEVGAAIALDGSATSLVRFNPATPGTATTVAITGITAGETLVGIDLRPQTGQFYGLGVDATANTATLYLLDPQGATATAVGSAGQIAYVDAAGGPVDLPPASIGYGIDFNPAVDRLRIVAGNGLNCRVNPSTGAPVDGNLNNTGAPPGGINPDAFQSGLPAGSTGVQSTAYTNSFGQSLTGGVTTQYTLDAVGSTLAIQNPPNAGTQTQATPITLNGAPLVFTEASGFDIPSSVSVAASNAQAIGEGWAVLQVNGASNLYRIDLTSGAATLAGTAAAIFSDLAILFSPAEVSAESPVGTQLVDNAGLVDFGITPAGTPVTRMVRVRNFGNATLSYTTSFASGVNFSVTQNATGSVGGANSAFVDLEVTFQATAAGATSDTLRINSNDSDEAVFDIPLQANFALGADTVTVTGGSTRFSPLANDPLGGDLSITAVSNPAIGFDGRTLIIPEGFTGSFTYTVSNGVSSGVATVTVVAGTPVANATNFSGLLYAANGDIAGWAKATISSTGTATVQLRGGTASVKAKVSVPTVGTPGSAFTSLGNLLLLRNANGTVSIGLSALGGGLEGSLRAARTTATAERHHIALAAIDPAIQGGGFAIATVSTKGIVKITGTLPDGLPFTSATCLSDNGSFSFFTPVSKGAKPPALLGGELFTADLAATDITGELAYLKLPQLPKAKGTHLTGVDTILNANGSLYPADATLPAGPGLLRLLGGNLNADEENIVTVTAGVPALVGSLKAWTGVKAKVGRFSAKVEVPAFPKPVKGAGLYLPKSARAWGYFPGKTDGGRIDLVFP